MVAVELTLILVEPGPGYESKWTNAHILHTDTCSFKAFACMAKTLYPPYVHGIMYSHNHYIPVYMRCLQRHLLEVLNLKINRPSIHHFVESWIVELHTLSTARELEDN